jgi:hypothetical protein
MKLPSSLLLLVAATACAPATQQNGGSAGPGPAEARSEGPHIIVQLTDSTSRPPTSPGEIALVSYVGPQQQPLGCTRIASFALVTSTEGRMREAVLDKGGEIGATLVVISHTYEVQTENNMSRTGVGVAQSRTQYGLEAYDCR